MFSFFKKSKANDVGGGNTPAPDAASNPTDSAPTATPERGGWLQRLRKGLARTGQGLARVFTGARVDAALYEELESALLMADAGVQATDHLMKHLQQVKALCNLTVA
jgi:fused signal recognition particle receptor